MHLSYSRIHTISAAIVFIIAAIVYCLTVEPTVSFWDCGEFIISAYKLEVGHSPGAPFYMLTANFFTLFTNDTALVAKMVNYMSALASAATILFLFLSITHLCKRIIVKSNTQLSKVNTLTIISSGMGSLAYTFSDTFWFSAVEAEVYAYSSLFTAVVFWLILKWEEQADKPHSDRWLILITYLMGLSIGVHLLNLLCIPAIVLVYYFRKKPTATYLHAIPVLIISLILLAIILYGIVPGIIKVSGWFELVSVNTCKLPFNSGVFIYLTLLAGVFIWGIFESYQGKNNRKLKLSFLLVIALLGIPFQGYGIQNLISGGIFLALLGYYLFSYRIRPAYRINNRTISTVTLCLMMFVIGYSSYAVIMIRSAANTPMDQNSPDDIFSLGSFLNREQYGYTPLLYGYTFSSERKLKEENGYCSYDYKETKPTYTRKIKDSSEERDSYIISGHAIEPLYAQNMFFPRMHSREHASYGATKANLYQQWIDIQGKNVTYDRCGELMQVNIPTQWENLKFFFRYQLNYMYWRYFFWNFVGRQNDIQGHGGLENGNWITGIPFIDEQLVGDQEFIPSELKENRGRNVYYCLPLLLGIIGMIWQFKQGKAGRQSFLIVAILFFMTGIAIVIYLNQTPFQARERDYAYAGSFYAFAIWIGLGVAGIIHLLKKRLKETPALCIASLLGIVIPIQMATQTWDDHDRSGRYVARDFGQNYILSAQEENNPILFTMGDNDTFPLWYNQEVEGFQTHVRTCNLSYLQKDWYISEMKRNAYNAPPLAISWSKKEYLDGTNDVLSVRPEMKQLIDEYYTQSPEKAKANFGENPYELSNILSYWARAENEKLRCIPTDSIVMKLDKEAILRSGMLIPESLNGEIPAYMHISLKNYTYLTKRDLMMLEIISGSNWERPVYVAISVGPEGYLCFEKNFIQEGLLYRFTPFDTQKSGIRMDTEKTYDCMMNKFKWGGIENENVYMNEDVRRMYLSARRTFSLLVQNLINEGKKEKALNALNYSLKVIPPHILPHDYQDTSLSIAESYYLLNEKDKADKIITILADKSIEYINWYLHMKPYFWYAVRDNCLYHLYILDKSTQLMSKYKHGKADLYAITFNDLLEIIENKTE